MPGDIGIGDVDAGHQPVEHPVEAVLLGTARAARRAQHRLALQFADHDQIAGIDRHAGPQDTAARRFDRRRNDVARIAHRGSAEYHQHVAFVSQRTDRLGHRFGPVWRALFADDAACRTLQPRLGNFHRLVEHAVLDARQHGLHEADPQRPIGMHGESIAAGTQRNDLCDDAGGNGERDDLHRRHHLASFDRCMLGDGGNRDRRVDSVDGVDQRLVDGEYTGRHGVQVHTAGGRSLRLDIRESQPVDDPLGGAILRKIVWLQHSCDHFGDAGSTQHCDIVCAKYVRLAETAVARRQGMRENRAFGVRDRDRSEPHAASPFALLPDPRDRSAWITSAKHRNRDLGGAGRADVQADRCVDALDLASALAPSASSRSTRLACVFRLPSAPT